VKAELIIGFLSGAAIYFVCVHNGLDIWTALGCSVVYSGVVYKR
jgi:hypothetical protein